MNLTIDKFWLRPADERAGITDSLLLPSGMEILSAIVNGKYDVFMRTCGDVRIVWKDLAYRDVSQFPNELMDVIRKGELDSNPDAYVDMNNWYEVFVYNEHSNCIYSAVEDVDISEMNEETARQIVLDAVQSALYNIGDNDGDPSETVSADKLEDWWRHNGAFDRQQASGIPYSGQENYLEMTDQWWNSLNESQRIQVYNEFFSEV